MNGTATTTLTDFLLARIAEDEAVARDAGSGAWSWDHGAGDMCNEVDCPYGQLMQVKADGRLYELMSVHGYDVHEGWQGAAHIARHDPTRVLAECAAKRRIVQSRPAIGTPGPAIHVVHEEVARQREYVFQLLALPYADHPDYDASWSP